MIGQEEIVNHSDELDVHPSNVQRDYVFGWVLTGIYSASDLGNKLVLKGGNCFRKAYFESARYSPDLDFATTGQLSADYLHLELNKVCDFVQTNSGVRFEKDRTRVMDKPSADPENHIHEARLYFHDFFGEESQIVISVRLDVSEFAKIFLPVQTRNLIHAYSDSPNCTSKIKCLKLEEMLAAKLKCLIQRRHSADLYDFVRATFVSPSIEINQAEVVSTFLKMTIFSSGPRFVRDLLVNLPFQIIRALWDEYVVCPKEVAVDFDQAVEGFKNIVDGMFGSLPAGRGEFAFFPPALRNPIMEAGYKLTLLRVVYQGIEREVEPYSLKYKTRRDGVSLEYFYVYDRTGGKSRPGLKSFVRQGCQSICNTDIQFEPRAEVELSKAGEFFREKYFQGSPGRRMPILRSSHRYTIVCSTCGKRFYREEYNTRINPHKDKYGNRCLGRMGYLA